MSPRSEEFMTAAQRRLAAARAAADEDPAAADYEAWSTSRDDADRVIELAADFVTAVQAALA